MAAQLPSRHDDRITRWVHQHGPAVRGYLRALLRHQHEADDLAQEVFRRAWKARATYRENGSARAYLLRIADRLACDRARQNRREVNLDGSAWANLEPATNASQPSDQAGHTEAQRQLDAALQQLSPAQQRVLLLRYYGQMTFADIARTTNCPLNTILSHCRRGLLALRDILVENPL